MNQLDRNKVAIRLVLQHGHPVSFQQLSLQAGEGLWTALQSMIQAGEVGRVQPHSRAEIGYRLTK